jgi:hypothetical protein
VYSAPKTFILDCHRARGIILFVPLYRPWTNVAAQAMEKVPDHSGFKRPPDSELFAPPPPEIGQVLSAGSTLRINQVALLFRNRVVLALVGGFVLFFALAWSFRAGTPDQRNGALMLGTVLGAGFAFLLWISTRFSHECNYVGREGIAQIFLNEARENMPVVKSLRFADATELQTDVVRHHQGKGSYSGTSYSYVWMDDAGNPVYTLKGTYRAGKGKMPARGNSFHFAVAAQAAWNNRYIDRPTTLRS